jgi:hypothetical protein
MTEPRKRVELLLALYMAYTRRSPNDCDSAALRNSGEQRLLVRHRTDSPWLTLSSLASRRRQPGGAQEASAANLQRAFRQLPKRARRLSGRSPEVAAAQPSWLWGPGYPAWCREIVTGRRDARRPHRQDACATVSPFGWRALRLQQARL